MLADLLRKTEQRTNCCSEHKKSMKPLKCVAAYRYGQSPEWWDDWSESSLRLLSTCHLTRRKICDHKTFKIKDKNPSSDATFPQPDLSSSTVGEKWESWTLLLLLCSNNTLLIQWCNFHLVTWPCKYYSCKILGEKTEFAIFFFSMIYIINIYSNMKTIFPRWL